MSRTMVSIYVLYSIHALYCFSANHVYVLCTRWRRVTGTCAPVVRDNHDNTTMSSNGLGPDFTTSYLDRASKAARLAAATCRNSEEPRRDPRARFWRPRLVKATKKQTRRDEKTDSGVFQPTLQVLSTTSVSQDAMLLSALPATVRAEIHIAPPAPNGPIDFSCYFPLLDFEFDLRTEDGLSEFTTWRNALGSHAWSVRSLTLKHWTSWWGFGVNSWTSSEDKTHFSRGPYGELMVSRTLPTPAQETCKCSMEQLLAQQDATFDLQNFRVVTTPLQFVNCLRAGNQGAHKPTLVDAAGTFAELLQEHSRNLSRYHGLAGGQCVKCNMPSLFLCGHLSTREEKDGSDVVFDAKAMSKPSRTSVRLSVS